MARPETTPSYAETEIERPRNSRPPVVRIAGRRCLEKYQALTPSEAAQGRAGNVVRRTLTNMLSATEVPCVFCDSSLQRG